MNQVIFSGHISVLTAAKILKKDPCWVRAGIISGWLPIGVAVRNGEKVTKVSQMNSKLGRINYYISPKLFQEYVGGLNEH